MKKGILILKILLVIIALVLGIYKFTKLRENKLTTIKIDVTAEIMVTVDNDDVIKKVEINEDNANAFSEDNLKGKKLTDGLTDIVNLAKNNGYLFDYQDVKIAVISNDKEKVDRYTNLCQDCINNMQSGVNVAKIEPTEDEIDIYSGESQGTMKAKYDTNSVEEMGRIIYGNLETYIQGEQNSRGKWLRKPVENEAKEEKGFDIYSINIDQSNKDGVYAKPESYYYVKDSKIYLYLELELFATSQKDNMQVTTKEVHKIFYNGSKTNITKHEVKVYEYTNNNNQNNVNSMNTNNN